MYADIAQALPSNKAPLLDLAQDFRNIVQSLKSGSFLCSPKYLSWHISFALKRAAQLIHHSKTKYYISKYIRQEIEFFCDKLHPLSDFWWEAPIAHIIQQMPTTPSYGNSSLTGMGGYSLTLKYWWHMSVPEEVQQQTLLHKKDNTVWQLPLNLLRSSTTTLRHFMLLLPPVWHMALVNRRC